MVLIQVELLSGYSPVAGSLEEVRPRVCVQLGWEQWWMSTMQDCMKNRDHSCGQRNTVLFFTRNLYTQSLLQATPCLPLPQGLPWPYKHFAHALTRTNIPEYFCFLLESFWLFFAYFQLKKRPLVKKVESEADRIVVYLEEVSGI